MLCHVSVTGIINILPAQNNIQGSYLLIPPLLKMYSGSRLWLRVRPQRGSRLHSEWILPGDRQPVICSAWYTRLTASSPPPHQAWYTQQNLGKHPLQQHSASPKTVSIQNTTFLELIFNPKYFPLMYDLCKITWYPDCSFSNVHILQFWYDLQYCSVLFLNSVLWNVWHQRISQPINKPGQQGTP